MTDAHNLADLVIARDENRTTCQACQWRCTLASGETGRCQMRIGVEGGIAMLNYERIAGAALGSIEDYRLWHFFPDTMTLALGGWGYATLVDQERGLYGALPEDPAQQRRLDPERAANVALERLCRGVIWAFGEPAVNLEYVRNLLQLCRATSRYTALVTTGAFTIEALDALGHYLDGMSLDLRGFSDASYARLGGLPAWREVLDIAERAQQRWQCHLEVTTRIHHGVNDNPDELAALIDWIRDTLGAATPWHILPGDTGSATAASTMRARRLGHERGLFHIYGLEPDQETLCSHCEQTLITRTNGITRIVGLDGTACTGCGQETGIRRSIFK
ncbi:radical SAM protein [Candidatus Chloroploca sp. Khr17]|uniref:radical SAM protein n=1 Tax=Candidatus Chloroploca sp. Khr17 TaxID=2496869 RepID=UPI00101CC0B9|nr:radical SAM protein [Candidatus Chloroploca sp. Khr17]